MLLVVVHNNGSADSCDDTNNLECHERAAKEPLKAD
jgi:hypothetical protein